jgi:hypothetical protein
MSTQFLITILTHPAFTAAIGFLAGHFLAIGRDRRKEFNEAAKVINEKLFKERRNPTPLASVPSDTERDVFAQHLFFVKRRNFYYAVEKYNKIKEDADIRMLEGVIGCGRYKNESLIINEINNLLRYTKRR